MTRAISVLPTPTRPESRRCSLFVAEFSAFLYHAYMTTYAALFRGINVGGHNIIAMKDLRTLFEDLGCLQVESYIQSGNLVFHAHIVDVQKFSEEASAEINRRYGFAPLIILLSRKEIEEAIRYNPFDTSEGKLLHFFFLADHPASPDLAHLEALKSEREEFTLHRRTFYLYAPEGIARSELAAKVEQCVGCPVTARNWRTVNRLLSMMASGSAGPSDS